MSKLFSSMVPDDSRHAHHAPDIDLEAKDEAVPRPTAEDIEQQLAEDIYWNGRADMWEWESDLEMARRRGR